jgi:hypothetical protein
MMSSRTRAVLLELRSLSNDALRALRYAERVLAMLGAGSVCDELAVVGHQLMIAIVNGFTLDETGDGGGPPAPDEGAAMARDYVAALPPDRFPNLVALAGHFASCRSRPALRAPARPVRRRPGEAGGGLRIHVVSRVRARFPPARASRRG